MRRLWKWLKRGAILCTLLIIALLAPVVYVETMCQGDRLSDQKSAILPVEYHRPESRTFMTYPEWHIVHAYEDYAKVIQQNDPHDFAYFSSIRQFWSSLCAVTKLSTARGEIDISTKQMVYVVGASFSAELVLKAAYEETAGRFFTWLRGPNRAPLDDVSAGQARIYAEFLQQVPWYNWQFRKDVQELRAAKTGNIRDQERYLALGLEYGAKAFYADVISQAVASTGGDELTLRMVVTGATPANLQSYPGVRVIRSIPQGVIIETPRYRALTHLMMRMAADGVNFAEIAGNDEVLFTGLSGTKAHPDAFASFPRQGFGDYRHLFLVEVADLADHLRTFATSTVSLEHIHDY